MQWEMEGTSFRLWAKGIYNAILMLQIRILNVETAQMGRPGAVVRAVSLSHQVVGSSSLSADFAGERLVSVYPFPRPHSCGSLRHWVCPNEFDINYLV